MTKAVCYSLLSADTAQFVYTNNSTGKTIKTYRIAGVKAPHLSRSDQVVKNEPGAFKARECVRVKMIGQSCDVLPLASDTATVTLPDGNDVALLLVRSGWAYPIQVNGLANIEDLMSAHELAISQGLGVHGTLHEKPACYATKADLDNLAAKKTKTQAVVEEVMQNGQILCYLTDLSLYCSARISGISLPSFDERPSPIEYIKDRLLQRVVELRVDGITTDGVIAGSLVHPVRGSIAEYLLKDGEVVLDDETIKFLRLSSQEALRNALRQAQNAKVGLWKPVETTNIEVKKEMQNPSVNSSWYKKTFNARLVDIYGGSCICVLRPEKDFNSTTITPYDVPHVLYLSSLRSDRGGWQSPTRNCIIDVCAGKLLRVSIDYMRYVPDVETPPRASDDLGRLHYATITTEGVCLNVELIKRNLARPERHKAGEESSPQYEAIIAASKLVVAVNQPVVPKLNDYVGPANAKRARNLLPSLCKHSDLTIFIERVMTATRYRAFIPSYSALVSISLAGLYSPQTERRNPETNTLDDGEPFAQQCISWAQLNILFKECTAAPSNCDAGGSFNSRLWKKGQVKTVQEELLSAGFAMVSRRFPGPFEKLHTSLESEAIKNKLGIWSLEENVKYYNKKQDADQEPNVLGDWGMCTISHCESCKEIYLQKHNDMGNLHEIEAIIRNENINPWKSDHLPNRNNIVLAKYDGAWYRARIKSVTPKSLTVDVYFIDYGNGSEIYANETLAPLPAAVNVIAYPPLAHKVALAYIKSPSIDPEKIDISCDVIMDFGEGKCECVGVTDGCPRIRLSKSGENLTEILLNEGLVKLEKLHGHKGGDLKLSGEFNFLKQLESKAKSSRIGIWQYGDVGDTDDEVY